MQFTHSILAISLFFLRNRKFFYEKKALEMLSQQSQCAEHFHSYRSHMHTRLNIEKLLCSFFFLCNDESEVERSLWLLPSPAHQRCRSDKNVHKFQRVIRSSIGANCICVRAFVSSEVKIIKNHIKLRFSLFWVHLQRFRFVPDTDNATA